MPALAAYPLPAPQAAPEPCEIEWLDGRMATGLLLGLDAARRCIEVQAGEGAPRTWPLAGVRQLTLTRVITPLSAVGAPGQAGPLQALAVHEVQPCVVQGPDGALWRGQTIGHALREWGLFLFPPAAGGDDGAVRRVLFPATAVARHEIGLPLGHVLAAQAAATPAQIEAAVAAQQAQRDRRLGALLVARQVVSLAQLQAALDEQARQPAVRLGDALLALGHLTPTQLDAALVQQQQDRQQPLGAVLRERGLVTQAQLTEALATRMGYPLVDLASFPVEAALAEQVAPDLLHHLQALPLVALNGRTVVALADPSRPDAVPALEAALGTPVAPVVAEPEALAVRLQALAAAAPAASPPTAPDDANWPVLLNALLAQAVQRGAGTVLLAQPVGAAVLAVRLQRGTAWLPMRPLAGHADPLPAAFMAWLQDAAERGAGSIDPGPRAGSEPWPWPAGLRLPVATLPLHDGGVECVVHLPGHVRLRRLDQLGLRTRDHTRLQPLLARPSGLLLVAGGAGSGRTSTLHAMLGPLVAAQRRVCTLESRLDVLHPGVSQAVGSLLPGPFNAAVPGLAQVAADAVMVEGPLDAAALQALLAQAAAGALVLVGTSGRTAAGALARWLDAGVDAWLLADTLLGVHAQHLLPRLCTHCRSARPATEAEVAHWLDAWPTPLGEARVPSVPRERLHQAWLTRRGQDGVLQRFESAGCPHCQGTGRRGSIAVHELMVATPALRRLVQARAGVEALHRLAVQEGMQTQRQDALDKMLGGAVPPDELPRLVDLDP